MLIMQCLTFLNVVHLVVEIHTLILAVMILVHMEKSLAHEYSTVNTLEVKHIELFGCIFIFLRDCLTVRCNVGLNK